MIVHTWAQLPNIVGRGNDWTFFKEQKKGIRNLSTILKTLQKQPPRQFSKISVLFFQEQPFYNFPGWSICSSNRHEFSRRVHLFVEQTWISQEGLYVLRTDTNFPGGFIEKTCFFQRGSICSSNTTYYLIEQILIFPETLIYTSNTYEFSRSLYFLIEQILIFQEALSSPRTHTSSKFWIGIDCVWSINFRKKWLWVSSPAYVSTGWFDCSIVWRQCGVGGFYLDCSSFNV